MAYHCNIPEKQVPREFTSKEKSDIRTLMRFVEVYCREKHVLEKSPFTFNKVDVKLIRRKRPYAV